MTEQKLENKFEAYKDKHPDAWNLRILFEPGYMFRNIFAVYKGRPPKKECAEVLAIELPRIAGYGVLLYEAVKPFLK
jgi:hypothetical protein